MKKVEEAGKRLKETKDRHKPSATFALFSGGHDSLCSTHLAMSNGVAQAVVHINTEIGIEETREFVRNTCQRYNWPLIELRPPRPPFHKRNGEVWGEEGQTAYEALVMRWGFPGPKGHTVMYNRLKERCLRQLEQEYRGKNCKVCEEQRKGHGRPGGKSRPRDHAFERPRLLLITGVRKQESRRRMGHIVAEQIDQGRVWCAPLVDWIDEDKRQYIQDNRLSQNQVAIRLCMSGECLCGAYARPEELSEITVVSPTTAAYIRKLEEQAKCSNIGRCKWGEKPKTKKKTNKEKERFLPLCVSCENKYGESA